MTREVTGHRVDGVREIFPRTSHAWHLRLSTELAVRADFTSHTSNFGGENTKLLNHRVDNVGGAQEFAFQRASVHIQAHGLGQVPLGNSRDGTGYTLSRPKQVLNQRVDRDLHLAPRSSGFMKAGTLACPSRLAHYLPNALQLLCHLLVGRNNGIKSIGNFSR